MRGRQPQGRGEGRAYPGRGRQVQAIATAESTVAALERAVRAEVDKLQLSPLDRADAEDLITLLASRSSRDSRARCGQGSAGE